MSTNPSYAVLLVTRIASFKFNNQIQLCRMALNRLSRHFFPITKDITLNL